MIAKKTLAAGLVALSALLATAPASATGVSLVIGGGGAQFVSHDGHGGWNGHRWREDRRGGHRYGTLSPRQVRQVLRDKGYRQIQYLDRRGRVYEARATNWRGHRVGLVVSARNGAILNVYRL